MPESITPAVSDWLHRHITTLSTIDPEAPLKELEPLVDLIGDARVVALGEGAHFIEEFWTVRRWLVRFLHERLGFQIVAAEFDIGEGEALDAWLRDAADPRPLHEVSRGASDWGMAAIAHWLRSWGAPRGLRFVGLDAPNGGVAFAALLTWVAALLREIDPGAVPIFDRIEPIAQELAGTSVARSAQAWARLGEPAQDALTAGLARLHQRVRMLDEVLVSRSDRARVDGARRRIEALACADYALRAYEAMHRGAEAPLDLSVRDRFMADSVLALLEREPSARVALLSHNGHVQKEPVVWGDYLSALPLGRYLRHALGDGYRVIGTTTTGDRSSEMELDAAREVGFRVVDIALEPPQPGSLEAALVAVGLGERINLVPLRAAATAGVSFNRLRAQSGYLTAPVAAAYDAVITLPRLTLQQDLGF